MKVFLIGYAKYFKLQFLNHIILFFFLLSLMNLFKAFDQRISINGEESTPITGRHLPCQL